jgi:hypothetical protein
MSKKKKSYQGGRTVNPRAAAMRRNRPIPATAAERLTMAPIPIPNPRGFQEGSVVENYNDQVKRKYGGGKL